MYWYYLVLKKCKDLQTLPDEDYYRNIINLLITDPVEIYCTFEYDSLGLYHCNTIFSLNSSFMIQQHTGCHIHLQKINNKKDMFHLMKYIHKDYRLSIIPL